MFKYDATGVSLEGPLLPEQEFLFRIMEAEQLKSKSGYDMVKVRADIIQDEEYTGWPIFHYVTFLPKDSKGAGIAIHFLKAIGEPWEGEFEVTAENWIGKTFRGQVIVDEYQGRKSNKLKHVSSVVDADIPF